MAPRLYIATHFYDGARDGATRDAPKKSRRARRPMTGGRSSGRPTAWSFEQRIESVSRRQQFLRVETRAPAMVHWSSDGWLTVRDVPTWEVRSGVHVADLTIPERSEPREIRFTFYWPGVDRWEGQDFTVHLEEPPRRGPKDRPADAPLE